MLLHEFKNDDGIKSFFTETYEFYMKVKSIELLNYLYNLSIFIP